MPSSLLCVGVAWGCGFILMWVWSLVSQDAESAGGAEQDRCGQPEQQGESAGVPAGTGGLLPEEEGERECEDEDRLATGTAAAAGETGERRYVSVYLHLVKQDLQQKG